MEYVRKEIVDRETIITKELLDHLQDALELILGVTNVRTYSSLEQIGVPIGSETVPKILEKLPDNSELLIPIHSGNNTSAFPHSHGNLCVEHTKNNCGKAKFWTVINNKPRIWRGVVHNDVWSDWIEDYNTENPPTANDIEGVALDNEHNIKTYTSLSQLGLSNNDFSSSNFAQNVYKVTNKLPNYGQINLTRDDNSIFTTSLVSKINSERGTDFINDCVELISITKFGRSSASIIEVAMAGKATLNTKGKYVYTTFSSANTCYGFTETYNNEGFVTKTEGREFLKSSDALNTYLKIANASLIYLSKNDASSTYVTKEEAKSFAKSSDYTNVVRTSDITDVVRTSVLANYVRTSAIADVVRTGDITDVVRTSTLSNYVKNSDITDVVRTSAIKNFITADAIKNFITADAIKNFITKSTADSSYATKADHNMKTYTALDQLGLSAVNDIGVTFSMNVEKIMNKLPSGSQLVLREYNSNLSESLASILNSDLGVTTFTKSTVYSIVFLKTGAYGGLIFASNLNTTPSYICMANWYSGTTMSSFVGLNTVKKEEKPKSGKYTGTGSGFELEIGGGNAIMVNCQSKACSSILMPWGGFYVKGSSLTGGSVLTWNYIDVHFKDGTLFIDTSNEFINQKGVEYTYEVLS